MAPQNRATQLDNLQREFPSTEVVRETQTETLLKVDHSLRVSSTTEYGLTLFVKVLSSFPKTAPVMTMPYTSKTVQITPPNINPSEAQAYEWDPEASSLVEAVRNAFQNAADRWGPIAPPTMEAVALQLSGETDQLLSDLASNPNCLDAYCYQLPIVKQMREAGRQTVEEVERVANENGQIRPAVEELEGKVVSLQSQLQEQVDTLQRMNSMPLLTAVCTPEALIKTLEGDIRTLTMECDTIGKRALAAYKTDKRQYQELLEQYKAKSVEMHKLAIKKSAYSAQNQ